MSWFDILREADGVTVLTGEGDLALSRTGERECWRALDVAVAMTPGDGGMRIELAAPASAVKRIHLRWRGRIGGQIRILGDHWERGYGDLEWRGVVPERVMPWYFLVFDGERTYGYGVKTGARSIASWRVDSGGVSLWLDVRCGGVGVELGDRRLEVATVVARDGSASESAFEVARALCRLMCEKPLMPKMPVYGGNNWYYAYGDSSHEQILADTRLVASLSPDGENRPFMVIDDGWQVCHGGGFNGGPWDTGNDKFPDMPGLATAMAEMGVRPGIWFRPLWTRADVSASWLFPADRLSNTHVPRTLDPSVPAVLDLVAADVRRIVDWGFELIKYDYTTFDICGWYGCQMPREVTQDGWSFADRGKTTAEVILGLYRTIRQAAGDALVLGCNTIGHLAAGLVEVQRTGDDTSGIEWERTRQRGVNSMAFRLPQHGTFFAADADCVGLTNEVPWEMNRQWLDLVARSGTPLFVSASPDAVGPAQAAALKAAFATASKVQPPAEPIDWLDTKCPTRWQLDGEAIEYNWYGSAGTAFSFA